VLLLSNQVFGVPPRGNKHPLVAPASQERPLRVQRQLGTMFFVVSLETSLQEVVSSNIPPLRPTVSPNRIAPSAQKEGTRTWLTFKEPARHAQKDGTKTKRANNSVFHAMPEHLRIS